jgi:hypothetical protein
MLFLEAKQFGNELPPFGFPARGWMFLEEIPRTTIYEENNGYVSFNRLPRNLPGRSKKRGENFI